MRLRHFITITTLAIGSTVTATANDIESASRSARADLNTALSELSDLRDRITGERLPLARELRQLETAVTAQRAEIDRLQRLSDSRSVDLDTLRNDVEARETEWSHLQNLVNDYLHTFESRISHAEWDASRSQIRRIIENESQQDPSAEASERSIQALEMAVHRIDGLFGGRRFTGSALDTNGLRVEGTFLTLGPVALFSDDANLSGLAVDSPTLQPRVVAIADSSAEIAAAVASGSGLIPVDPTQGDALRVADSRDSVRQRINKGGLWIWPILGFGVAAFLVTVLKAFQILRIKEPSSSTLYEFSNAFHIHDRQAAISIASAMPKPFDSVLSGLAATIRQPREAQEEIAFERGLEVQLKLERWLPFLALTAATTPLLGLLGTVTGMIKTFNLIQIFGTGDAGRLAGGISEALVTTEFGLLVAIPALIAHAFLARRARGVLSSIESITGSILHQPEQPEDDRQ